jgi:hypothetical protein
MGRARRSHRVITGILRILHAALVHLRLKIPLLLLRSKKISCLFYEANNDLPTKKTDLLGYLITKEIMPL